MWIIDLKSKELVYNLVSRQILKMIDSINLTRPSYNKTIGSNNENLNFEPLTHSPWFKMQIYNKLNNIQGCTLM